MKKISQTVNGIWTGEESKPGDKVIFRKQIVLENVPDTAIAYLAAETKYFLYVNGTEVVYEGGLFRESMPGCGYADEVDLAPFLRPGRNVLAVLVWYYGNEGRNNVNSGRAGFYFFCDALGVQSDESFLCREHPAYYIPKEAPPSYLYGGDHLGFDARKDLPDWSKPEADESSYRQAVVVDVEKWGDLYLRPIPFHRVRNVVWGIPEPLRKGSKIEEYDYEISFPYALSCFPVIRVVSSGDVKLTIYTDHYEVPGGPGDEMHTYRGHRIELICREGETFLESIEYLYGEKLFVHCSGKVEQLEIGYRETSYDTDIVGYFTCSDSLVNRLVEKAARTLLVCMRDNFMDCPDRERGQWIGDVSVQIPQVMFLLDDSAKLLVKKAIHDFLYLRKGKRLVGNVPGANFSELPSQSLVAISQWGLIAQYVKYTNDEEVLEDALLPIVEYLQLWETEASGLLRPRSGDWRWFDHLYDVDDVVLENAWYVSALRFALEAAKRIDDHRYDAFLLERLEGIEGVFHKTFWTGKAYASGSVIDDRANAVAVLAGLCPNLCYPAVKTVLTSVFHASVYMENFVLTALCEMGYVEEAYHRMRSRYLALAENDHSTLWEDFSIRGTTNHAWTGAPVTIAFRYFMGIDTNDGFQTVRTKPQHRLFREMQCSFQAQNQIYTYQSSAEKETVRIQIQEKEAL